jgi:hypothetical protein
MDEAKVREANRRTQARYREKHATRLATGRKLMALVTRQTFNGDHMRELADLLHDLFNDTALRELRKELEPARRKEHADEAGRQMAEHIERGGKLVIRMHCGTKVGYQDKDGWHPAEPDGQS